MLVFAGLWTQADREGRFRWQPRQLKLDILPFIEFDMGSVLDQLASAGFLVRYEVNGSIYGHIPSWARHQSSTNERVSLHCQTLTRLPSEHLP